MDLARSIGRLMMLMFRIMDMLILQRLNAPLADVVIAFIAAATAITTANNTTMVPVVIVEMYHAISNRRWSDSAWSIASTFPLQIPQG
jgi:hypothetical protein